MWVKVLLGMVIMTGVSTECDFDSGMWSYFGGHCYYLGATTQLLNYSNAADHCHSHGATLASPTSTEEANFIIKIVINCTGCNGSVPDNQFWIGLRKNASVLLSESSVDRKRANWMWEDGSVYNWQNWHGDEPKRDTGYVRMTLNGRWNDWQPTQRRRVICEKPDPITISPTSVVTSDLLLEHSDSGDSALSPRVTTSSNGLQTSSTTGSDVKISTGLVVGVAIGAIFVIGCGIGVVLFILGRRHRRSKSRHTGPVYYTTNQDIIDGKAKNGQGREAGKGADEDHTTGRNTYYNINNNDGLAGTPNKATTSNDNDLMYAEISGNRSATKEGQIDPKNSDVEDTYAVANGQRNSDTDNDDDEEVTMVENIVYRSA